MPLDMPLHGARSAVDVSDAHGKMQRVPKQKATCVVGARPNFIKMAAIIAELQKRPSIEAQIVHTGQHSSHEMAGALFRDLEIPNPDVNLEVSGGTHTYQTAEIMRRIEPVFEARRPDVLIVVGDVNSTLAASLVAAKMGIPIAHVEAGLRSFDRTMPEEINRILTDAVSDYLFVTEPSGRANLLAEGVPERKIHFAGNVMIDTLLRFRERAGSSNVLDTIGVAPKSYALVTLHRPSNVDDVGRLREYVTMLSQLNRSMPVVFPVHPRTRQRIEDAKISHDGIFFLPPQSYLDFLKLMSEARVVMTDSGGIQEETTILGVPCLTMRENTERPVTIEQGTNRLVGTDTARILEAVSDVLGTQPPRRVPERWDGRAAARILDVLESAFHA
jgi:UDP-N-acetylglucosamine 2-epimerase (non-hydrolysing)